MRSDMEEKRVCSYCGTIFDGTMEKCPLCGSGISTPSTAASEEAEVRQPVRKSSSGKYAAPRGSKKKKTRSGAQGNKAMLAAVIILAIAVLLLLYFIGDMIGWWPGFEDLVQRETFDPNASETKEGECTVLELQPKDGLSFAAAGESLELTVTVNLDCEEKITIAPLKSGLVQIVPKTDKPVESVEHRSMTYTVTAVAAGQTELVITCGEKNVSCRIDCVFDEEPSASADAPSSEPTEPSVPTEPSETEDPNFEPQLNYSDISLFSANESFTLRVTNLPDGAEVIWSSADEDVATVDENGKVTAVGGGVTNITAEVNGKTAKMIVRCNFETSTVSDEASLNYTDVTISVGETIYIRLYDANDDRITEGLTYYCANSSICSMDGNGITGVSAGTTTVTVTYNGTEYTCIVRVRG